MRLRTITETSLDPVDQIFRQSRLMWLPAIPMGGILIAAGVFVLRHEHEPAFGWCFTIFAILITLPFAYIIAITWHSENWLVRYRHPKLLIKFRSYLNCHRPKDEPVIIELNISDIAWIRKVTGDVSTRMNPIIFLDIKLKTQELSQLKQQLAAEAESRRFRFVHDPVMLLSDGILRIEWRSGMRITPSLDDAITMLQSGVPVREPDKPHLQRRIHGSHDFATQTYVEAPQERKP